MLFSETKIGNLKLKNRFVRSATWEGRADEDGSVTEELVSFYEELSKNEIGLIITGHMYVREDGKATPRQIGIYSDGFIDGLKKLTESVHKNGGKILAQLSHAGIFAPRKLIKGEPVDVSRIDEKEVEKLIDSFVIAALRAKEAGFDGIQLHCAHGYLISQFFSPLFNRRDDRYGGKAEKRAFFAKEIIRRLKKEDPYFPVLIKINCRDFEKGGLELEDSVRIAKLLQDEGADAIEVSGGLLTSRENGPCRKKEGPYFKKEAERFKKELSIPVILVGGIRSYGIAESILKEDVADLVSMSRPLLCEPDLLKRWKMGDRRKALCISDNLCLKTVKEKGPVRCKRLSS